MGIVNVKRPGTRPRMSAPVASDAKQVTVRDGRSAGSVRTTLAPASSSARAVVRHGHDPRTTTHQPVTPEP